MVLVDCEELEHYVSGWLAYRELKRRIEDISSLLGILATNTGGFWAGGTVSRIERILGAPYDFAEEAKRIVNGMLKGGKDELPGIAGL